MDNKHITQKQRLQNAFSLIREDVTSADRKSCVEKLRYSKMTLSRYLNGNIDDNDTAAEILEFLKQQIAKRDSVIAA